MKISLKFYFTFIVFSFFACPRSTYAFNLSTLKEPATKIAIHTLLTLLPQQACNIYAYQQLKKKYPSLRARNNTAELLKSALKIGAGYTAFHLASPCISSKNRWAKPALLAVSMNLAYTIPYVLKNLSDIFKNPRPELTRRLKGALKFFLVGTILDTFVNYIFNSPQLFITPLSKKISGKIVLNKLCGSFFKNSIWPKLKALPSIISA